MSSLQEVKTKCMNKTEHKIKAGQVGGASFVWHHVTWTAVGLRGRSWPNLSQFTVQRTSECRRDMCMNVPGPHIWNQR